MSRIGTPNEIIRWLLEQDPTKTFTVKEHRQKRSLTQNAYYWVLNDKLASVLGLPRDELHFLLLKKYAPCSVVTVLEKVPIEEYFSYAEVFATGVLDGRTYKHVKVYKESHRMDSKEFSRLLDGIVQECEQQGIETLTPSQIAQLRYVEPKE